MAEKTFTQQNIAYMFNDTNLDVDHNTPRVYHDTPQLEAHHNTTW